MEYAVTGRITRLSAKVAQLDIVPHVTNLTGPLLDIGPHASPTLCQGGVVASLISQIGKL